MRRRTILAAFGTAAAGTTATIGTGAFTSVDADRSLSIAVADDDAALLTLGPVPSSPNAAYVRSDDGETLAVDIGGDDTADAPGVNADAVTRINNLFRITNRGTQPVTVTGEKGGDNPGAATFAVNYSTEHPHLPFWGPENATFHYLDPDRGQNATVGVGRTVFVSLEVDTRGLSPGDNVLRSVTIRAERER
ncbi:hypothetical protein [Halobaculum lipolyticum]|uniref:DUF1102 domain-containing protein n=1 Tax=Halobaculum lipolyticum TaxID=3032001 RepID=A0ABD5W759_9EURY|nr:hypothetical protein [Halobaculum sp. DT31]